jgi:citronellol/citronellal dehydrogenase
MAKFGRLDICMWNAGIVQDLPLLDLSVERWNRHIDINLNGYFHVCQAVARRW